MEEKFLSEDEVRNYIKKANEGDEAAWEELYKQYERYIHKLAWGRISKLPYIDDANKDSLERELVEAGWIGFVASLKNFDPKNGSKFITYSTSYIRGEMSREFRQQINFLGLSDLPDWKFDTDGVSLDEYIEKFELDESLGYVLEYDKKNDISVPIYQSEDKFSEGRRVLQYLDILKILTDEKHSITKEQLSQFIKIYRARKYKNEIGDSANTVTKAIEEILKELSPIEHTADNDGKYRVKYKGYEDDLLRKRINGEKPSPTITDFSYVHEFSYVETSKLIQTICASDLLTEEDKNILVEKIVSLQSDYYNSPFWDPYKKQIKFNKNGIYGRLDSRGEITRSEVAENISIIQQTINRAGQIRFKFNRYTSDHRMVPKNDKIHTLSPYHIVVYHDMYYCIGYKKDDNRVWHYRIDLMSEVEEALDEEGKPLPMEITRDESQPLGRELWDPEKYMSEHLYMAYDKPRDIRMRIKNDDYTILHDWFADCYEKLDGLSDEEYDTVRVRTSPSMIVHWALQYGTNVEILDEEIRGKIREEVEKMREMYG